MNFTLKFISFIPENYYIYKTCRHACLLTCRHAKDTQKTRKRHVKDTLIYTTFILYSVIGLKVKILC